MNAASSNFMFQSLGRPHFDFPYAWASQVALVVRNPPANAGDLRDTGLIPGSGRSPGEGHGDPLQYSPHGERTLAGYGPHGRPELDRAEAT